MSYDALAESVRLLEGAPPASDARLSRRVRYAALAVDRDGDVAITMFLRRGVSGQPLLDLHSLELTGGGWRLLGGGGGPGDEALDPRPALADLPGPAVSLGGGGTAGSRRGLLGRRRTTWVSWAEFRAAEEVALVRVGDRHVPVAGHGMAVVVWAGMPPTVTALDASGEELGRVPLRASSSREYRDP
ncbi:hypothetical protein [Blastococcus saxobsidens]|uniref:Uncharacterized protein n=1 Tax=Blastococcus saxobsidens (strain DD2) TaxID=1146883 RepID=H6RQP2_BLASD|nr:hypothetical protein [Blastococcus saxobsidens]CCG01569.1 protein of unknown function [Blastococcus saxobsidens DD2]